jgi:PhnB protein
MKCTMRISPYLTFKGQCEAAFKFYEQCLGGQIQFMMTYASSPMGGRTALDWQQKILHATLALGDQVLQGSDPPPESYQKPRGFSVTLHLDDAPHAERIFTSLEEGGVVQFPLQETFWALRFGMVVDQFGTPWMINCSKA